MNDENGTCPSCAGNLRASVAIAPYGQENQVNVPVSMTSREVVANMLDQTDGVEGIQAATETRTPPEPETAPQREFQPARRTPARTVMPSPPAQMLMPRASKHTMLVPRGSDVGGYGIGQSSSRHSPAQVAEASIDGGGHDLAKDEEKPLPAPPKAKYKKESYPEWIRKLIRESFPKVKDEEVKGDADGAVKVQKVDSVEDQTYEKAKKEGKTDVERRSCGGEVIYWIAIDEIVDTDDLEQHRRIWDWAYALKQADAEKELGGCKSELCSENKKKKKCVVHRGGHVGNFAKVVGKEKIPEVGYVRVIYSCKCKEPPPQVEKPITGHD